MFAPGVASLHTAHLPVPKTLTSKSRVSITSKLIQNTGLQAFCSGHLRKTGRRGSYQFPTMLDLTDVEESLLPTPLFPLLTQKQGSIPPENVGAPTFLIFPHIFRTFLALSAVPAAASAKAGQLVI
jgi:hypothetical protein